MIDILVYLFENYLPDAYPEPASLARKLSAAGFEEEEITEALDWLDGLERNESVIIKLRGQGVGGIRVYDEDEQTRLPMECRGFLAFLEQAGTLVPDMRETVIDRVMALPGEVSLSKLKVIVLVVLWRRQHEFDALILEELLSGEDDSEYTCH